MLKRVKHNTGYNIYFKLDRKSQGTGQVGGVSDSETEGSSSLSFSSDESSDNEINPVFTGRRGRFVFLKVARSMIKIN